METGIEQQLRTGLRTSAKAVTVTDDLPARVDRRITVRRRQALSARVAVGTLAVAAVGAAVMVAAVTMARPRYCPQPWARPRRGHGSRFPRHRSRHVSSTPPCGQATKMIVFGGYDGGEGGEGGAAAYSPATGAWQRLADPRARCRGHLSPFGPELSSWRSAASAERSTTRKRTTGARSRGRTSEPSTRRFHTRSGRESRCSSPAPSAEARTVPETVLRSTTPRPTTGPSSPTHQRH